MSVEVKTPALPESVADALIVNWFKKPGDSITLDEPLLELETDKVVLEVPAPETGVLESIVEEVGATVLGDQLLAYIKVGAVAEEPAEEEQTVASSEPAEEATGDAQTSPAVRKALRENDLSADEVAGSGKKGRILKEDVAGAAQAKAAPAKAAEPASIAVNAQGRVEERVPMTRLRKTIAKRLLDATASTAMLTTFNEVNMQPLMEMRSQYKDLFEKTHDARLGFMSLFVKAATIALERFPDVNASIDGDDIVYHGYSDIGIAVSSPRGLVVPILRNTENMSLADVESGIAAYAVKARDGKLGMDEMQGGTFTITNGGVFGSLLSTPILNPPQSAILGMHGINKRVMVENDEMVIRPMMYLALSYDHRIIDGQSAVLFLKTIKELVEDPNRILLGV
ncbi:MAG: Dihydrolipoamide succinyltransferase component (E2) of 2-oxoglutarate dehydrogenase complex (EC [uncultured Thiotrichaceae bacterium]|uniref:Dihydrolipoyllysine-residue succinyltransferase component of 2-oxoglutarate dehydrogenase complex n=1 Tax=uncultured Thiotrichaceae bacterium TaxID=298394 RepID=A0A6S6SWV2_9GAMM|nr:MAG: Dihydrolipoamide succinyltransferase component (E2) of 2-oxoglutarate dehydrogenase complex (EC [uncultured Thiotrichaceae bacterium]